MPVVALQLCLGAAFFAAPAVGGELEVAQVLPVATEAIDMGSVVDGVHAGAVGVGGIVPFPD
jgi:hypothetical protein